MKKCKRCKAQKELSDFYKSPGMSDGLASTCSTCALELDRRWKASHPESTYQIQRRADLKKIGFPEELYYRLVEQQGGLCAICKSANTKSDALCADHDHTTGRPRGLLCNSCNLGLGRFKDDPLLLIKAIHYLERFDG